MQALSGRPVATGIWDAAEPNGMPHINLTRGADAVLVAPASADFIARLAQGRAEDLLSLVCLARPLGVGEHPVPLLLAPAMNPRDVDPPGHPAQPGAGRRRWGDAAGRGAR
jgi:phosphopantothenoylcysteine decarboxylase/phosphopantothenate--cysteine ligase